MDTPKPKYTRSPDGHVVGSDGFVVPREWPEFAIMFPDFTRIMASHCTKKRQDDPDLEELIQDFDIKLAVLPKVSKYRQQGFKDTIQTFDPDKLEVVNKKTFLGWAAGIIKNFYRTHWVMAQRRPLQQSKGNFSIGTPDTLEDCVISEEFLADMSGLKSPDPDHKILIEQFATYLQQHRPELVPLLFALRDHGTLAEAGRQLGLNYDVVSSRFQQLRTWGRRFHKPKGKTPKVTRVLPHTKRYEETAWPLVEAYLRYHPYSSAKQIAKGTGLNYNTISTMCPYWMHVDRLVRRRGVIANKRHWHYVYRLPDEDTEQV